MAKFLTSIVGLAAAAPLLMGASANAADLTARAVKAVAPPPVFNWTGCYLGVHAGGGKQSSDFTSDFSDAGTFGGVGALGGAQAGCNLQWREFVIGVEGEYWASGPRDRDTADDGNFTSELSSRNRWDGAISVRAGVTFDRAFIYGKLGAVWGRFDYAVDGSQPASLVSGSIRGDAVFTGVLVGAGIEYALTDNWTAKFEYNYLDYGNKIVTLAVTDCFVGECVTRTERSTIKEVKQIAKVGVNYKF